MQELANHSQVMLGSSSRMGGLMAVQAAVASGDLKGSPRGGNASVSNFEQQMQDSLQKKRKINFQFTATQLKAMEAKKM